MTFLGYKKIQIHISKRHKLEFEDDNEEVSDAGFDVFIKQIKNLRKTILN
jgi:hypothetical protein